MTKIAGRVKGTPNKRTADIREYCVKFATDPEYRENVRTRIMRGKAPHIEQLIWRYAFGDPKQSITLSGPDGGPVSVEAQILAVVVSSAGHVTREVDRLAARLGAPAVLGATSTGGNGGPPL